MKGSYESLVTSNELDHLPSAMSHKLNQRGFSPVLIVGLLALGIIGGTLLVQNGVSFIPKAAEQEPLNPSEGKTKDCSQVPEGPVRNDCKEANNKICFDDTVTYCDNRAGTPRAIRKSGGYWDPTNQFQDPKSGCVFDYREVDSKKSECDKSESKSGDVVYTTKEEAQTLDNERKNSLSEREKKAGVSPDLTTTACSPEAAKTYNDAKVANNLVRFYAIQKGAGGLCVPADLGVEPKDDVTVKVDGIDVEGRLMMCATKLDSPPKLYWAIASYEPTSRMIQVQEKQNPDIYTIESGFNNLQKARCVAGLDSGDKCNGV